MYTWAVFFHLIFVTFWLGGMLFTAAVLVPATRKKLASQKGLLFTELGTRFSRLSWVIFPLLIITGIAALLGRGYEPEILIHADFWQSQYGNSLKWKLYLFGVVLILSGLHDFWLGPKAADLIDKDPASSRTTMYRKATSWIGRANLLAGLIILYFAVSLPRW